MQPRFLLALSCGLLFQSLALVGCAHRAEVRLQQPSAPPSQRDLPLTTEWSVCDSNGAQRECVLEFPSPGAVDGVRDFRIYLRLPTGEGTFPIEDGGARGFLIQEVGRLRGKAVFTGGNVKVAQATLQRGLWRLDLTLTTNDGASVTGRAYLKEQAEAVRAFTRRFGGDIAALSRRTVTAHAAARTDQQDPDAREPADAMPSKHGDGTDNSPVDPSSTEPEDVSPAVDVETP